MEKTVHYSYCYVNQNQNTEAIIPVSNCIKKLPKIKMTLPKISLQFCENLNITLA